MRVQKIKDYTDIDNQYCIIVDAIGFCDIYIGLYHGTDMDKAICTPLKGKGWIPDGEEQNGIYRCNGVHFSHNFIDEHTDSIFRLTEEQYKLLNKIQDAQTLRMIKHQLLV